MHAVSRPIFAASAPEETGGRVYQHSDTDQMSGGLLPQRPIEVVPAQAGPHTSSPTNHPSRISLGRGVLKRWAMRSQPEVAGPLVERLIRARRIENPAVFLDPKLTQLHDPSLIPDLDRAAARLLTALNAREPIVIYGDYDVDGVTASAILYHTFMALRPEAAVTNYVPHRVDEGYGLHTEAIESLAAAGARVIVSVDCGVTAIEPARAARRAGVDLIITDHHNPPASLADLPEAFAVVHPRRPDSKYPFGELSGAGVAYKLAWRLATLEAGSSRVSEGVRGLLVNLLAFAALGAIADVVPLEDENRVIARFGMARIKDSPFVGLRELVRAARLENDKVSAWDVGFKLAPRLNACGRMAHAQEAVEMFTSAPTARAKEIAEALEHHNTERRAVEAEIFKQACELVEAAGMHRPDKRGIVLADPRWHSGVVGIVCSRLVERYGRPAILMQSRDGRCHGSGRSVPGLSLHGALASCSAHLERWGGHDMAAGMGLAESDLPAFSEAFISECNARLTPDQLVPELLIDTTVRLAELTPTSVKSLESLEPHGAGNPGVRVLVPDVLLAGPPTPMGKTGEHLALTFRDGPAFVRVTAWRWAQHREHLAQQRYDLVVEPKINTWGGRSSVEPELVDLRPAASRP